MTASTITRPDPARAIRERTVTRYTPHNIDAAKELIPADLEVELGRGVPAEVAHVRTVADIRALTVWPPGLVLEVRQRHRSAISCREGGRRQGL